MATATRAVLPTAEQDRARWQRDLERRTFELMDAFHRHEARCPRMWFPYPGSVWHCREGQALSAMSQAAHVDVLNGMREIYMARVRMGEAETVGLNDAMGDYSLAWCDRYQRYRRWARLAFWRRLRRAKHTPYQPVWALSDEP